MSRFYTISGRKVNWCCLNPDLYLTNPAFPLGINNYVNVTAGLGIGTSNSPFTGAPDANTVLPNQFEIDYIRVYKRNPLFDLTDECYFNVYPNPANSNLTIDLMDIAPKNIEKCFLISEDCKLLKEIRPVNSKFGIEVLGLSNGVYFIMIKTFDNPLPMSVETIVIHN